MLRPVLFNHYEKPVFGEFIEDVFRDFDRGFLTEDNAFSSFPSFRADVIDKGDAYELKAELPGFNKEDINLKVDGDTLYVTAEHTEDANEDNENYICRERRSCSYQRCFDLSGIRKNEINAEYRNGILELYLPKSDPQVIDNSYRIPIQ